MKVTTGNRQPDSSAAMQKALQLDRSRKEEIENEAGSQPEQMRSGAPQDSVGQLASELARARTRLDVQMVSSKAMKALANLKASAVSCSEKEKKKIARQIKRMEKLFRRIEKKMQQLSKEEQLEIQKKQAEKKEQFQSAEEIGKDLRSRRAKRRRDEKEYARKELTEDEKEATREAVKEMGASLTGASDAALAYGGLTEPSCEGASVDVSV